MTLDGDWESRRLPGSGAGPSPDRMLIGSEGILGVITEAWVRVRERPTEKVSCGVAYDDFAAGDRGGARDLPVGAQPLELPPARPVSSPRPTSAGPPGKALLVLGFESAHHPGGGADVTRTRHLPQPRRRRRRAQAREGRAGGDDAVSAWRSAFLSAPYLRDSLVACGVLSDTFETAITWDRFPDFHAEVMETAKRAVAEAGGGSAEGRGSPRISCRFTHVYPDGPAPYYTVLAPARRGDEVAQWDEIKAAVSETVIDAGGTITHHHAVGRDHRPWYDRQRPGPLRRRAAGGEA